VSPGLTGEQGTVSFQSVAQPNKYLRHYGFVLYLEDRNTGRNQPLFTKDATFKVVQNRFFSGFVAFSSVNYPDRLLRHQGYTLKLHPVDGSDLYRNDASFRILALDPNFRETTQECFCVNKKGRVIKDSTGGADIEC